MTREIIFRGKTKAGKWVEGWLIGDTQKFIVKNFLVTHNKKGDKTISPEASDIFEVLPETVGQYTGLTDINGVKIFEGDMLEIFGTFHHAVVYVNGAYGYIVCNKFISYSENKHLDFQDSRSANLLVVGNVYGNPELLEGK